MATTAPPSASPFARHAPPADPRAYDCPPWLERLFVYFGTLVGMAGPYGMIRQHDIRDWAQRKPNCHAYLAHRSPILRDGYWQLHCELKLAHPPALVVERRVAEDRFYRFIDRTWMAQQLPWAVLFFAIAACRGWLGIAASVAASVTGTGSSATRPNGARDTGHRGAGVQATRRYCGIITMARPCTTITMPSRLARLGPHGRDDPGWWCCGAGAHGPVWGIKRHQRCCRPANLVALRVLIEVPD